MTINYNGTDEGVHDTRWYSDEDGRICTIASFSFGDFEETPLFVETALEHNGRIGWLHYPQRWILGVDVATDTSSIAAMNVSNGRLWVIPDMELVNYQPDDFGALVAEQMARRKHNPGPLRIDRALLPPPSETEPPVSAPDGADSDHELSR